MANSEKGCRVPNCGKTRKDNTVLHSFPNPVKDANRYLAWVRAAGIDTSLDSSYVYRHRRICHDHFATRYLTWTRRLSPDAVPKIMVPGYEGEETVLRDITNTVGTTDHLPTTSADEPVTRVVNRKVNVKKSKPLLQSKPLLKVIKNLKNKNESYSMRLKKALNLSENETFLKLLNKFTTLAAMFTVMQFREIKKCKMGRRFTEAEKIMALSLYKRSPRAYKWLQKIFILPSAITLNRLIAQANLKPGINENIFLQLKKRARTMKEDEKLCLLLFDEMSIAPHCDYNLRKDEISGFINNGTIKKPKLADHVLVFMIRGVQKNYKQPIGYSFCSGSTSAAELAILIKDYIRKLNSCGLTVLGTVCDQGATNVAAINMLVKETNIKYISQNVTHRRYVFEVDNKEVIPLYDAPHLIKGVRNNFITKDLICTMDGKHKRAKWQHVQKLYEEDPAYKGIRLVKKLTEQHVNPDKFNKMKVKYATQVFSQKVGVTMGFLAEKKLLPEECCETADVILFFDNLFDSLNGSHENVKKRSGKDLLMAVTPTSSHKLFWFNAKKILSSIKFVTKPPSKSKQGNVPTIINFLKTIENIEYLIEKLFKDYNIKSVWMRHFNQDPLENFFGMVRSHGARNINPTPAAFESLFAALLINNLSGPHSPGSNCEEDTCNTIFNSMNDLQGPAALTFERVLIEYFERLATIIQLKTQMTG